MPTGDWLQYGSFGLLAALVVWTVWKGVPKALDMHAQVIALIAASNQDAMTKVCDRFEKEQNACRDERIAIAMTANVDREKSREAISKLTDATNRMCDLVEKRT